MRCRITGEESGIQGRIKNPRDPEFKGGIKSRKKNPQRRLKSEIQREDLESEDCKIHGEESGIQEVGSRAGRRSHNPGRGIQKEKIQTPETGVYDPRRGIRNPGQGIRNPGRGIRYPGRGIWYPGKGSSIQGGGSGLIRVGNPRSKDGDLELTDRDPEYRHWRPRIGGVGYRIHQEGSAIPVVGSAIQ